MKPLVTVIGMEAEPVLASFSSYNPGGNPTDPGIDIDEGMPDDDGTDLEKISMDRTLILYGINV